MADEDVALSASGYSLPDPAEAAGVVLAGVSGGDGASDVGGFSDFQSVAGSELSGVPPSRTSSRRGGGSQVAGGSNSGGGGGGVGRNKSINESIAERVLSRVGTAVDRVAERISEMQESGGGGESDAEEDAEEEQEQEDEGEVEGAMDRFKRAGRAVKAMVRMDFGVDLMRRIPPPPELGTIRAYIAIDRSKSSLYPTYKFYTQAEESTMDRFVLAARQEPINLTKLKHKRYIFSTDPDNCTVSASGYWGKLTSNFMGTNFTIFDRGERRSRRVAEEDERRVLGAVVYEPTTTTGSGGYRKMTALLPTLYKEGEDGMPRLERWEEMRDMRYMHLLTSKVPSYKKFDGQWHYCYKFGGRVKCPSKKNFQMVLDGDQESVVLLFGKVSKNLWVCDFTHPLSAHQAFAIALSSLSSKMCYAF